jgi:hypothetical protein
MKTKLIFCALLIGLVSACIKDDKSSPQIYSFEGKVQKGPFVTGTTVTLNELNSKLGQTGRSFTTTLTTDDGSFGLNNIELNSSLALLTANGFFFNEIYGELSTAPISLQAIANLTDKKTININVLTHLIKGRVEYLVLNGMTFQAANTQAKSELLSFLGVTDSFDKDFDALDISQNDDYNAVLLAFSIILQRKTLIYNEKPTLVAELTQLLTNLSSDFKDDGQIGNRKLIDTLLYNISQLNLIDVRKNIEKRYSDLGISTTIPNFEKYITKFQEKNSANLYTDFSFPAMAPPFPEIATDSKSPNILVPHDTVFTTGPYSMAAITPLNSTLTIKFKGINSNNYFLGAPVTGWELINEYPNGFTLTSQRQNALMTMLLTLEGSGSATIEYYENGATVPTITKKIKWE